MLGPVFACQFSGHTLKLLGKIVAGNTIVALQHGRHRLLVPFLHLPQPGGAGMFTGPGVGNIKHIAQTGPVAGIVHQSDPLGATPYIPAHLVVPQAVLSTGGGVRALGVDQQLFVEWIFIKAGGSSEKGCPFLPTAHKLGRYLFGHLPVKFCFGWHGFLSSLHVK